MVARPRECRVGHGFIAAAIAWSVGRKTNGDSRRGETHPEATEFIGLLEQLDIEVDRDTAVRAHSTTIDLAREHALSAYAAAYLELAMRRGLPLVTADQRLARVAEAVGVSPVR